MIAHFSSNPTTTKESAIARLHELISTTRVVAVDTETISLKDTTMIGYGLCFNGEDSFFLTPDSEDYVWGLYAIQSPTILKLYFNVMFDLRVLELYRPDNTNIYDVSLAAHLNGEFGRLVDLASLHDIPAHSFQEVANGHSTFRDVPIEAIARKCCEDAEATYRLFNIYNHPEVDKYVRFDMDVVPVLLSMSQQGLDVDNVLARELGEELEGQVEVYKNLCDTEGFSPSSPKQVAYILSKRGHFLPFTKTRKSLSSAEDVLRYVDDPIASVVLHYRELYYLSSHYLKPLYNVDVVHPKYNLDAITTRISCSNPNMMNIPKGKLRSIFIPRSGIFSKIDYSQIQLRILAYLSNDREMKYIYEHPPLDIHSETAKFMNIPRDTAKNVNFSMVFGASPQTIAETANITDIGRAKELIQLWSKKYRGAWEWIEDQKHYGLRTGRVTTIDGRRIKLPDNEDIESIYRKAVNYPIQASEAEIAKNAMVKCYKAGLPLAIFLHDELVFDGKVELPDLSHLGPVYTPLEVKELKRWE